MSKYPDECPVFDVNGVHVTLIPCAYFGWPDFTSDTGDNSSLFTSDYVKPLTRAARRLVRWAKGGAR